MSGLDLPLRISARADYAVRAATHLATGEGRLIKGEEIARLQGIPPKFLVQILAGLRHARLVWSHRGMEGGYRLARPPDEITIADVIRAVEGSLISVQGSPPGHGLDRDNGGAVREVWLAVEASIDSILGTVTLADLAVGALPGHIAALAASPVAPAP
jgi:Rrf2 family protein